MSVKKEQEITGISFSIVHQGTAGYDNRKRKLFFVYAHLGPSFTRFKT